MGVAAGQRVCVAGFRGGATSEERDDRPGVLVGTVVDCSGLVRASAVVYILGSGTNSVGSPDFSETDGAAACSDRTSDRGTYGGSGYGGVR